MPECRGLSSGVLKMALEKNPLIVGLGIDDYCLSCIRDREGSNVL